MMINLTKKILYTWSNIQSFIGLNNSIRTKIDFTNFRTALLKGGLSGRMT